jgi:hypothetical protein
MFSRGFLTIQVRPATLCVRVAPQTPCHATRSLLKAQSAGMLCAFFLYMDFDHDTHLG